MGKRLLVLSAGTGAGNNLIRSLKTGDPSLLIVGCHADRFVLKKSSADRNYLAPPRTHPDFTRSLRRVIAAEKVDLLMPATEQDVEVVSRLRNEIPCCLFLPPRRVVELCQDKYRLAVFLRDRGLPVPLTYPVTDLDKIAEVFRRLPAAPRVWCRMRAGSGSMGATPVKNADQARSWIDYWVEMRGVAATSFTLSEYLPGRCFACQSLWKDGRLILVKTYERLSYFGGAGRPSGVSSIPALAKLVFEPRLVEASAQAILTLDARASGAFDVDLKDGADGVARITEINAGRLISGTNLFDLTGKHNMAVTFVRLALGEPVEIDDPYDFAEGYYMVRDLDTRPGVFHADELFEGIQDARQRRDGSEHVTVRKEAAPWVTHHSKARLTQRASKSEVR